VSGQSAAVLSLFDLDNTLLDGDSDYAWAQFLIGEGVLDAPLYEARNAEYLADYTAGHLDIRAFLDFQLKPLAEHPMPTLLEWRERFVREVVAGMMLPAGRTAVRERIEAGHLVAIVTATNSFITRPIADAFGVEHLIGTEPEIVDGRYTGRVHGTPSFQDGKIVRVREWLASRGTTLAAFAESWFFSDSRNDVPLLGAVSHPVAVDPDSTLAAIAIERAWPIVSWRGGGAKAAE